MSFETMRLQDAVQVVAPDGSDVHVLCAAGRGSMIRVELKPGVTSKAVTHRTVEEIWFILDGSGEMWRADDDGEEVVALEPGTCMTIPVGTRFQFRTTSDTPLRSVAVTMPPWPGMDEAYVIDGPWEPTEA